MLHNQFSRGWIGLLVFTAATLANAPRAEAASEYKVLHSFGKAGDGAGVFSGLALDTKGKLYGTTTGGGAYGYGTIFQLTPEPSGRWTETVLPSFCRLPRCSGDGASVWDTPVLDSKGRLYDISTAGIFQMVPGAHGWSFKVIYGGGGDRSGRAMPPSNDPEMGDLLLDTAGNLYGPFGVGKNYNGGAGELSLGLDGWREKDLYDFCLHPRGGVCLDGAYPEFRLAWDPTGNLYGVTREGGTHEAGVACQLERTARGGKSTCSTISPPMCPGRA